MDALVPLQFRPTIIIFVGPTGHVTSSQGASLGSGTPQAKGTAATQQPLASVYEHFYNFSTRLDAVLYQGIGLLTIDDGSDNATIHSLGTSLGGSASRKGTFLTLLNELLHAIQEFRSSHDIEDKGYPILVKHPQVYIVGQADSPSLSTVAKAVNTLLGHDRTHALICYVLIEKPLPLGQASAMPSPQAPQWTKDLLPQSGAMPLVNFCYIYEERGQSRLYMQELDMRYAIAEMLFGLVATGITASPSFRRATNLSLTTSNADAHIGSIGTSLITFPRVPIESYCADMHGVELVNNWISTIQQRNVDKKQQDELRKKMRAQAQIDATQICNDLSDNEPRPGFAERQWPSLSFLEDDYLTQQLKEATENIFQNFLNLKQWEVDFKGRETQAMQAFDAWKVVAKKTWEEAKQSIEQEANRKVDTIWLHNAQGINAAKTYVRQLEVDLGQVRGRPMDWSQHKKTYEEALRVLEEHAGIAPSSMQSQSTSQQGSLPMREQKIVNKFAERFKRLRVPTIANLVAIGVMAMPPLVLLVLTLFPLLWLASPQLIAIASLIAAGVSTVGSWLYYEGSKRRVRDAKEDLLRAYCLYFASQCECWEDELRITVILDPLINKVHLMHTQLEGFEEQLKAIAETLQKAAEQTENDLFESPSSYRDVLIGATEIFSKHGYRLKDFNETIVHRRQAFPKEPWHETPSKINEHLCEFFAANRIHIIGIQQDKLIQHIRQFTHILIFSYLKDDLVEIAAALEAEGDRGKFIIEQAVENAQVLYRPYQNIPELSYYICGRDEQRSAIPKKAIPATTTMVRTTEREWMLLACFWTGGAHTRWETTPSGSASPLNSLPSTPTWQ